MSVTVKASREENVHKLSVSHDMDNSVFKMHKSSQCVWTWLSQPLTHP